MDPQVVKTIVIGVSLFGIFGVVPIVMALMVHQQKMAEIFAKTNGNRDDLAKRVEVLEERLAALEPRVTTMILERDDLRNRSAIGTAEQADLLRQRSP